MAKAKEAGYDLKIGKFPYSASGKARAIGAKEGMVKLIFDKKYGELLGAHIVGNEATELIAELGMAKSLEATPVELAKTMHAHPTCKGGRRKARRHPSHCPWRQTHVCAESRAGILWWRRDW